MAGCPFGVFFPILFMSSSERIWAAFPFPYGWNFAGASSIWEATSDESHIGLHAVLVRSIVVCLELWTVEGTSRRGRKESSVAPNEHLAPSQGGAILKPFTTLPNSFVHFVFERSPPLSTGVVLWNGAIDQEQLSSRWQRKCAMNKCQANRHLSMEATRHYPAVTRTFAQEHRSCVFDPTHAALHSYR